MALAKGLLSPLFEHLLITGFAHLDPRPVTMLMSDTGDGEDPLEPPVAWRVVREPSDEALSVRAGDLLESGPVLLLPPWRRRPSVTPVSAGRRRLPFRPYEAVLRACAPVGADSVIAAMTPIELWTSDASWATDVRHDLGEHWDTLLLLYSTGLIRGIDTRFITATAFLRAKATRQPPLKIFQAPHGEDESAIAKDYETLLAREGGRTRYGYVIRELPSVKENLDFDRHDPVVLQQRSDLAGFGSVSTLGDLSDMVSRIHMAHHAELISAEAEPDMIRLVEGRDVQRDGTIAPPSDRTYWEGYAKALKKSSPMIAWSVSSYFSMGAL